MGIQICTITLRDPPSFRDTVDSEPQPSPKGTWDVRTAEIFVANHELVLLGLTTPLLPFPGTLSALGIAVFAVSGGGGHAVHAHDVPTQTAADLGMFGLPGLLALLGALAYTLARAYRDSRRTQRGSHLRQSRGEDPAGAVRRGV
jgi:hypothetical protein